MIVTGNTQKVDVAYSRILGDMEDSFREALSRGALIIEDRDRNNNWQHISEERWKEIVQFAEVDYEVEQGDHSHRWHFHAVVDIEHTSHIRMSRPAVEGLLKEHLNAEYPANAPHGVHIDFRPCGTKSAALRYIRKKQQ